MLQNNPWLKKQITDQMRQDGKSPQEADDLYRMMILRAEMQSMPESDWTQEMHELDRKLEADPKLDEDIQKYGKLAAESLPEFKSAVNVKNDASASASAISGSDLLENANGVTIEGASIVASSVSGGTTVLSTEIRLFPSAPDLTDHHRQAVVAVEPLDVAKPPPVQTAMIVPPEPPGGGFEV